MVIDLRVDKCGQIIQNIDLCIANVLHPAINVVVGLLILCLLCPKIFLQTEVLLFRLLDLCEGSIVG